VRSAEVEIHFGFRSLKRRDGKWQIWHVSVGPRRFGVTVEPGGKRR
jgi:hypothetical protein